MLHGSARRSGGQSQLSLIFDQAFGAHRFDLLVQPAHLLAIIETVAEGKELLIVIILVDPACQREGLGRRLMHHAEEACAAPAQLVSRALGARIEPPFIMAADQERRTLAEVRGWLGRPRG